MSAKNGRKRKAEPLPNERHTHKNVKIVKELNRVGCRKHGEKYLVTDVSQGDLVCEKCGIVVEDRIICDEAEWRNFADDSNATKWTKSRAGDAENPFLSADFNLGTIIKSFDDSKTKTKDDSYAGNITKQYQRRSVDNALKHAFRVIDNMGDRINLSSSVLFRAKALYSESYRKKKFKGNILEMSDPKTAACLYIACRLEHCSRSKNEICGIYNVNKKSLSAAISWIVKCDDIELPNVQSLEMIDRFTGYLEMTKDERKHARSIAERIELYCPHKRILPEIIAGAAIYVAMVTTKGTLFFSLSKSFGNRCEFSSLGILEKCLSPAELLFGVLI